MEEGGVLVLVKKFVIRMDFFVTYFANPLFRILLAWDRQG